MPVKPPRAPDLPLSALRAFEAAARLGGFAPAATELGVSAGAITAHVKGLEQRLGLTLFRREVRGVRLTEAGARVLPTLTQAFDSLDAAQAALRHEASPLSLSIASLPALAQLWLRPRLADLARDIPGLTLSITAAEVAPTAKRSAHDLTLFMGGGGRDMLVPVAAPEAGDLPRLTDSAWADDWARWRAGAPGADLPGRGAGPVHSLYALAVEEALAGRGVLMGRLSLIEGFLARGTLVTRGPQVAIAEGPVVAACNGGVATRRVARWIAARLTAQGDSRAAGR
ncbi:LysR family transcriptional regulator [Jannaschia pohangensis]|uniref:Transcriptional regulator, LysR family n=1 Tax=Jannaschia pohangensis TaxID=390807 RepID=A0A1I3N2G5_9RHOB|nr:LysR family transcriptional regulator [Jannaschia pohangensis]SFJ03086.1 transcriptional regulator, LysR family [Jannaschia pohangensis]